MNYIYNYFYPEPKIHYGKWEEHHDYLNFFYHGLQKKIKEFICEAGVDPYDRCFNCEPLIDFVIDAGVYDKSADYMYRFYVYHLLEQHQAIDKDAEELDYLYNNFTLLPEGLCVLEKNK